MKQTDQVPYGPIVRKIFYVYIAVGVCLVGYVLWTGGATIPKKVDGDFLRIERGHSPFSYWLFLASIGFGLIGLPVIYLWQGGVRKK